MRGVIKWFSSEKGYGFVTPEDGGKDVFVHHSSIKMDGYKTLNEGDVVSFDAEDSPKGVHAVNVTPTGEVQASSPKNVHKSRTSEVRRRDTKEA